MGDGGWGIFFLFPLMSGGGRWVYINQGWGGGLAVIDYS